MEKARGLGREITKGKREKRGKNKRKKEMDISLFYPLRQ
jgi:hypothetical protein